MAKMSAPTPSIMAASVAFSDSATLLLAAKSVEF
eukprot:CAMPEP_0185599914 /NCGR_PEP_ID=MMETSP0434-20130131/83030_1 /TAXON_ID=626734 ORGANISM="Favella taraikaensis, Strain Fe Narragansett Bay" /NCGR_SAMPLE_ID=MMETSP0434 /ASSEMBLY_ACC=CAM_ASM_000379 /LENGTH=33 /DNA_ID= /DNA_START= /DNA_END= /DNA_ORIENTATION=